MKLSSYQVTKESEIIDTQHKRSQVKGDVKSQNRMIVIVA